jgi:hypothetical protein
VMRNIVTRTTILKYSLGFASKLWVPVAERVGFA